MDVPSPFSLLRAANNLVTIGGPERWEKNQRRRPWGPRDSTHGGPPWLSFASHIPAGNRSSCALGVADSRSTAALSGQRTAARRSGKSGNHPTAGRGSVGSLGPTVWAVLGRSHLLTGGWSPEAGGWRLGPPGWGLSALPVGGQRFCLKGDPGGPVLPATACISLTFRTAALLGDKFPI